MKKTQKSFRLEADVVEVLNKVKEVNDFRSDTEALMFIIREYNRQSESIITDNDIKKIADMTVDLLTDKLKNQMDRIRLASTFSERYSYMILDAINTMLYEQDGIFLLPANGETKHEVLKQSEENFKGMIERNKQIHDDREGKRGK